MEFDIFPSPSGGAEKELLGFEAETNNRMELTAAPLEFRQIHVLPSAPQRLNQ